MHQRKIHPMGFPIKEGQILPVEIDRLGNYRLVKIVRVYRDEAIFRELTRWERFKLSKWVRYEGYVIGFAIFAVIVVAISYL